MKLKQLENELEKRKGQKELIEEKIQTSTNKINSLEKEIECTEQAQTILQQVAQETQEELEWQISEIVSLAMNAVFSDPYKLKVNFVIKRGVTECELKFQKEESEELIDPLMASGGGAVDVAAFALQIGLWNLQNKKSRNVLILDEPLKWLKGGDLPIKGSHMIKEISKKLGIQIIMISHSPELIEGADRVFEVKKKKGISQVNEV